MTTPSWLDALPPIRAAQGDSDAAVDLLQSALPPLSAELMKDPRDPDALSKAYSVGLAALSRLLNATERLAAIGVAMSADYPYQAKYLVSGSVLELVDNILDLTPALGGLAGQAAMEAPTSHVQQQPRTLEAAQELIAKTFPELARSYAQRFEKCGLPVGPLKTVQGDTTISLLPADYIKILHLSDLHRTNDEKVSNPEVLADLFNSLEDFGDLPVDLVIISGDLAQSAEQAEYDEAEKFFQELAKHLLRGDMKRLLVVPGNHDIHWPSCASQPFFLRADRPKGETPGLVEVPKGFAVPSQELLLQANANFRASFERLTGERYPTEVKERCRWVEPVHLPDLGIIALDTNIGMHHFNTRPHVDREALIAALRTARRTKRSRIIAVGHHGPPRETRQDDGVESWCFDRLVAEGVSLYLHGHTHETQLTYYTRDGIVGLSCVGVGSLVAGPAQRPESTSRQYNVIHFPLRGRQGRAYVRKKERRDLPWKKDIRFGRATDSRDYVDFLV